MKNIALITAGGSGTRMQQDIPKQFLYVKNKPILIHTLETFQNHPSIDVIIVVGLNGWTEIIKSYAKQYEITKLQWVISGGTTGLDSIQNGVDELSKHYDKSEITVLIHDGNRPLISQDIISDSLAKRKEFGSAVAAIPCNEVVFKSKDGISSTLNIPRDQLLRTQTPHTYSLEKLLWAYQERKNRNIMGVVATCDLMCSLGEQTFFSKGSEQNIKITTMEDIDIFISLLETQKKQGIK
jgi:2-C-methyl-D-erythritol 4-phosphate cytidylyltransferase